ncbi:MAG: hypothetical protein JW880_06480 [Candidatus Thermoplasmatota archaeon]|nr:hypothetical protein [Candidatus Thermoplasmatota archaeon]
MSKVRIRFRDGPEILVVLRPDETPSIRSLLSVLPFSSRAQTWGDEVYFEAPFHADLEKDGRAAMEVGEVAFWPDGDAVAVFFGPTPASSGASPQAYSPCNILGRVEGDTGVLKKVKPGTPLDVLAP